MATGSASRGTTFVEVMVGVAIALLTVLVIHRVFVASEALRHDMQAAADAQQAGLFVLSRLALEIANAGAGLASSSRALATCPATQDIVSSLRPIAALITDGGSDDAPDSVVVRYGVAPASAIAVSFAAAAPTGSPFSVDAIDGFAPGDRVVAISGRGDCIATDVTAVGSGGAGVLDVAHAPVAIDLPGSASLLNLGAGASVRTLRFDVAGDVLRTTDLAGGDAPNPLASNVVNLKFQYGVDGDGDGTMDTWVRARSAGDLGNWTPTAMLAAPLDTLRRVKALRVGVIVRSEHPDRAVRDDFAWVLFDCAATDKTRCPGRLAGTIPASTAGGRRYRVYETVVPLRNQIWGAS